MNRWSEFLRGSVAALIVLVVCLVAIEVVLRTTHVFNATVSWSEPDSLTGFRFTPNRPYWQNKENDHPISGMINEHGLRDRQRTLSKPEGTIRVCALGDSYVEALQVEADSTFLALAEDELTRDGSTREPPVCFEILNMGRSGMTQTEELVVLSHDVETFDPDVVLVLFVPHNDIQDVRRETAIILMRPFYEVSGDGELVLDTSFNRSPAYLARSRSNFVKQRSALASLVAERYNALRRSRRIAARRAQRAPQEMPAWLTLCTAKPDDEIVMSYRLNKRLFYEMNAWCAEREIMFIIICANVLPTLDEIPEWTRLDPTFDPGFFDRDLGALADSLGCRYLGLQETFERCWREDGIALSWGHWNYSGHRVVAAELVAELWEVVDELGGARGGGAHAGTTTR